MGFVHQLQVSSFITALGSKWARARVWGVFTTIEHDQNGSEFFAAATLSQYYYDGKKSSMLGHWHFLSSSPGFFLFLRSMKRSTWPNWPLKWCHQCSWADPSCRLGCQVGVKFPHSLGSKPFCHFLLSGNNGIKSKSWNRQLHWHNSIFSQLFLFYPPECFLFALCDSKSLAWSWCIKLFFLFFSVTGSRKRSLEEDEDFGAMQVTAAQNRWALIFSCVTKVTQVFFFCLFLFVTFLMGLKM